MTLRLLADFTIDRELLKKAVARCLPVEVFDREAATPKSSRTGLPSDGPSNYYAEIGSRYFLPERRVQPTIAAMGAIADHLAGLAGRKNLIWLSGSFPISTGLGKTLVSTSRVSDASNFEGALERLSHTLSNSNIAVYAVAAAGVAAPDTAIDGNISTIGTYAPYGGESNNEENRNEFLPDTRFNMTMSQIAAWTGGLPAMSNDLTDNISRAFKDGRDYYVVAFYAEHWDGQFHRLKVTVDRRGAHARTRMGYFAADDAELNADAKLQAVSRQVTPTAEIPLDVIATQSMLGGQTNVLIRVEALGAALAFDKAQAGWTAHARLRFIQLDSSGGPILEVDQMLDMHLSEQNHRDALASVVRFTTPVALERRQQAPRASARSSNWEDRSGDDSCLAVSGNALTQAHSQSSDLFVHQILKAIYVPPHVQAVNQSVMNMDRDWHRPFAGALRDFAE